MILTARTHHEFIIMIKATGSLILMARICIIPILFKQIALSK